MPDVNIKVKTTGAKKAETSFQKIGKTLLAFGAAAASVAIVAKSIGAIVDRAGKLEGVTNAFGRMGGNLRRLQDATDNTVDNFTLMATAVKASQLGVTGLADKLAFAKLRARETGEEVSVLTEQLILGIGRQSVMRLDDLGISLVRVRKEMKATGSFAAALDKIISEDMSSPENQKALSELADSSEALATGFKNAADNVGTFLTTVTNPGGALGWITDLVDTVGRYFEVQAQFAAGDPYAGHIKVVGEAASEAGEKVDQFAEDYAKWVFALEAAQAKKAEELEFWRMYTAEMNLVAQEILPMATQGISRMTAEFKKQEGPIKRIAESTYNWTEGIQSTAEQLSGISNQLIDSFDYIFTETLIREQNFADAMVAGFRGMLERMIAEMAAKAAVFGILNAITGGSFGIAAGGIGSFITGGLFSHDGAGLSPRGGGSTVNINMPNVAMINSKSIRQIKQAISRDDRLH